VTAFRLVVLVAVWVLGTSTLSLAQEEDAEPAAPPVLPAEPVQAPESAVPLLAPDVRGLPLVFAKGVLEDAGFAWKVRGKVEGYAVNLVASQNVAPGTQVVDNGAPYVVLELRKNPAYEELGVPMNESPYPGTKLVLASGDEPEVSEDPIAATGRRTARRAAGPSPRTRARRTPAAAARPRVAATAATSSSPVPPAPPTRRPRGRLPSRFPELRASGSTRSR
jgi:PASTA domain